MLGLLCALACSAALTVGPPDPITNMSPVTIRAVYVDDTVPHECQVVQQAVMQGWPLVIVAVQQYTPRAHCKGVDSPVVQYALEWYPFGAQPAVPRRVPCGHVAYIVQNGFAWPGHRPPTVSQRAGELISAESCFPDLILGY